MQILAWNGGGSSNYSSIVEQGGYTIGKDVSSKVALPDMQEVKADIKKAGQFAEKMEHLLAEELEDFAEEVKEMVDDYVKVA